MVRLVLEIELCYIIFIFGYYMYIGVLCLFLLDFIFVKIFVMFNILLFVGILFSFFLKIDLYFNIFNIVLKLNFNFYMILNV